MVDTTTKILSTSLVLLAFFSTTIQAYAATPSEAFRAGWEDAYYNTYDGQYKPQDHHTQAYIDGFETGLRARDIKNNNDNDNGPTVAPTDTQTQAQSQDTKTNSASSSNANANNNNQITINNFLNGHKH